MSLPQKLVYLVKAGGTRTTGSLAAIPTAGFAALPTSDYYPTVYAAEAVAGSQAYDELILVSHLHEETLPGNLSLSHSTSATTGRGAGSYVSVDDASIKTKKDGAIINMGTADIIVSHRAHFVGITFNAGSTGSNIRGTTNNCPVFEDCTINMYQSRVIQLNADNCSAWFFNCSINNVNSNSEEIIYAGYNNFQRFENCTFTAINPATAFIDMNGTSNGGVDLEFINCDMSGIPGPSMTAYGSAYGDQGNKFTFDNCKLGPTWDSARIHELTWSLRSVETYTRSEGVEWAYYQKTYGGIVEATDQVYRDETMAYPLSGVKTSWQFTKNDMVSPGIGGRVLLPIKWMPISNIDKRVITVHFTCSNSSLTTEDVSAKAMFPYASGELLGSVGVSGEGHWRFLDPQVIPGDGSSTWKVAGGASLTGSTHYVLKIPLTGTSTPLSGPIEVELLFTGQGVETFYIDPDTGFE